MTLAFKTKLQNKIHFVINNRKPNRFQFAPVVECMSVQAFEVRYKYDGTKTTASVFVNEIVQGEAIWVNCQLKVSSSTVDQIAINDGFENTNEFFEDFSGKIIHWTNFKY